MAKKNYESKYLVKIKTNMPSSWAAVAAFFCAFIWACIELKIASCSAVNSWEVPAVEGPFGAEEVFVPVDLAPAFRFVPVAWGVAGWVAAVLDDRRVIVWIELRRQYMA